MRNSSMIFAAVTARATYRPDAGDDSALRMAVFYADGALTRPTYDRDILLNSQPPASPPISTDRRGRGRRIGGVRRGR
jgi:hypothetical protein